MEFTDEKEKFRSAKSVYNFWEKENLFSADPSSGKKPFSLLIPPPNLTGELHLGHAMQHSILDAVARYKRLQGFDVLLLPGVDHAGIQFEATFNKLLQSGRLQHPSGSLFLSDDKNKRHDQQQKTKYGLTRDEWLKKAWEFKEEIYKKVSNSWRFMGLSADWDREVFTLDSKCRQAVFEQFKTYFDKGLIYKGPYIVQWCPKDQTAIEDAEVEYEERKDSLYFIKYPLVGSKEFITIATVRPETMFADVAVAVNPKDKRYKNLVGKKVLVPFVGREVPVIADELIDIKFGSGALKVDPAHDLVDYQIGKKNNLEILSSIGKDGKLTKLAGKFAGQKAQDVRKVIFEDLEKQGLIEKVEELKHSVPVCERCKTVTELLISDEWFVKVDELAKGAIAAINRDEIKFLPKDFKKILVEWLKNIHDWCISRSLWWGHRIPVWYPSTRSARSGSRNMKVSLDRPGPGWVQDEQVLDTWFSSGLWPMSTLGWPETKLGNTPGVRYGATGHTPGVDMGRYFPWDFEISAPEIKFLWIARMIMISKYFTGKSPFKTMFFHGMLGDLQGRKFSKSLGNGIDPLYLIDQWGVDATRMALYSYSIPGRDGRVSKTILDERGKNYRNFGTKLRNIAKYVIDLKPDSTSEVSTGAPLNTSEVESMRDNEWIMEELGKLIKDVTKYIDNLELHLATEAIYEFVWHKFADKYIEASKGRRGEAQPVLEHVLKQVLILLHPFMPFVTEEIYQKFDVKRDSIMIESWPTP